MDNLAILNIFYCSFNKTPDCLQYPQIIVFPPQVSIPNIKLGLCCIAQVSGAF